MTVAETFGSFSTQVEIIASDIDSAVFGKSPIREFILLSSIDALSPTQRQQFFQKGKGSNSGKVKVVPELRDMVTFKQLKPDSQHMAILNQQ